MARHRNVRNLDYDDEYDEIYGGSYGHSVDDEYCVSPGTEAQYSFNRGGPRQRKNTFSKTEEDLEEDVEDTYVNSERRDSYDAIRNGLTSMDATERAKLMSCVEGMQDVVGESIAEAKLMEAARQCDYDLSKALDMVLNAPSTNSVKSSSDVSSSSSSRTSEPSKFQFKGATSTIKSTKPTADAALLTSNLGRRLNFGPGLDNTIPTIEHTQQELDEEVASSETIVVETKPSKSSTNAKQLTTTVIQSAERLTTTINSPLPPPQLTPSTPQRKLSRSATPSTSREGSRRSSPSNGNRSESKNAKPFVPDQLIADYNREMSSRKPLINLVVIGHVDAGKSTLMGRLLVELGYVSKKLMHRYETDSKKTGKASFMYAWVLDETEEERTRGITMDIAQSKFETQLRSVTLLDAPGHRDFIPNMITGAAQADAALLVVDATVGEFEAGFDLGGQTREHTLLIRLLGVTQLAVVVNKLDNCSWSQERYAEIVQKLGHFLKQTGFKLDTDVTFVPCSGLNGVNLAARSAEPDLVAWYSGPCLIEVIDSFKPPERPVGKPFRMSVGDIFKGLVSGTSVSGRIEAGAASSGQKLIVMPAAESCTIKSVAIDEMVVNQAFAGDHVTIVLNNIDQTNLTVGSLLCEYAFPAPVTSRFEARVVVFPNVDRAITKGLPVVLHYNGTSEQASIKRIVSELNKATGEVMKKKPRCLTKNTTGVVQIEVSRPICVELASDYKDLGRFLLRVAGTTIAAGLVNKIL